MLIFQKFLPTLIAELGQLGIFDFFRLFFFGLFLFWCNLQVLHLLWLFRRLSSLGRRDHLSRAAHAQGHGQLLLLANLRHVWISRVYRNWLLDGHRNFVTILHFRCCRDGLSIFARQPSGGGRAAPDEAGGRGHCISL